MTSSGHDGLAVERGGKETKVLLDEGHWSWSDAFFTHGCKYFVFLVYNRDRPASVTKWMSSAYTELWMADLETGQVARLAPGYTELRLQGVRLTSDLQQAGGTPSSP